MMKMECVLFEVWGDVLVITHCIDFYDAIEGSQSTKHKYSMRYNEDEFNHVPDVLVESVIYSDEFLNNALDVMTDVRAVRRDLMDIFSQIRAVGKVFDKNKERLNDRKVRDVYPPCG